MKRIIFLLPSHGANPAGGYKVVYEYANRLIKDKYKVSIIYPASLWFARRSINKKIKNILRYLYFVLNRKFKPKWFELNEKIDQRWVWSLHERHIPKNDFIFATTSETAEYLNKYKKISPEHKFYLIQGYATWFGVDYLHTTFHYPMRKIVIAEWLQQILEDMGENCTLIHNGFDFDYFSKDIEIKDKNKHTVTMLFSESVLKGCENGFKTLEIVKARYPELTVNIFGIAPRPAQLPEWYHYYRKPDKETHNKIYNEAAIFMGPSLSEGFCLTPPEAMQCGCAVVCTDIGGYTVICKHEETALISPKDDPGKMADNIIRLIEDDDLRYRIAENGHRYIKQFTWEKAYDKLRNEIEQTATIE